jgi:hypothetical protein
MGESYAYRVWVQKSGRKRDHLTDTDVDGKIILKRIFWKWDGVAWTVLVLLRIRTGGGLL